MADAKWTPGPWKPATQPGRGGSVSTLYGDVENRRRQVCAVAAGEEREANLRLIAAAPDLEAVAAAYEQWEADLILADVWQNELPRFTQKLWDRFLEIQKMRNAARAKARGT